MIFKREWDFRFKTTLGEWMDKPKNGIDFYWQESPRNRKINAHFLPTMIKGHTEEWDITMLWYAIIYSDSIGSSLSPAVRSRVDFLKNVRNETMKSLRASLSVARLKNIVQEVQFAFESLGLSTRPIQNLEVEGSYDEKTAAGKTGGRS